MDDIISREAALYALGEAPEVWTDSPEEFAALLQWEMDVTAIKALPSADAVEVVRCRDCKNWQEWENGTGSCHRSENGYNWFGVDATDYCSYGERREDGEE